MSCKILILRIDYIVPLLNLMWNLLHMKLMLNEYKRTAWNKYPLCALADLKLFSYSV